MGTKSVREIVEAALRAHVAAQTELTGVNIYKGLEITLDQLPTIVVSCDSALPPNDLPEGLGNYLCSVSVALFTSADASTALASHRDRAAAMLGAMQDLVGIKAVFASQGDATCYDVIYRTQDDGRGERTLGTTATYDVLVVLPA